MMVLGHDTDHKERVGQVCPIVVATSVAHDEQISTITDVHIVGLGAEWGLSGNFRTKCQHSLRGCEDNAAQYNHQGQHDERGNQAPIAPFFQRGGDSLPSVLLDSLSCHGGALPEEASHLVLVATKVLPSVAVEAEMDIDRVGVAAVIVVIVADSENYQ